MSGANITTIMAVAALALWLATAVRSSPAIWRGYRYSSLENDKLRAFLFYVAALQIAFIIRRLAAPDNGASLTGLYAMSIMCAFVGVMTLRDYTRDS